MFIWGWASDADPDFILSVLTCDQFMGWSDTFWCNEDYSRMYQEQKKQLDLEERAATIKEMQRIAYEENPYVVFYYDNQPEAWRTDRFEGWTKTPTNSDFGQVAYSFSNETYMNLRPLSEGGEGGTGSSGGGPSPLLYVGLGHRRGRRHRRDRRLPPAGERGGQGLSRARYVGGKLLQAVGTLLFVLVLNFFLFRILPGDPERTLTRLQRVSPSTIDEVKKEFGLDRPLAVQFFDYLGDTARGELGISYVFSRPVSEVIGAALWPTILLVGVATVAATVIGTLMGIWGAWRRGSALDTSLLGFGLVTYAMPEFWLGMLLILGFAVALDWFPTSFMSTPGLAEASAGVQLVDTLEHLFLPALTLIAGPDRGVRSDHALQRHRGDERRLRHDRQGQGDARSPGPAQARRPQRAPACRHAGGAEPRVHRIRRHNRRDGVLVAGAGPAHLPRHKRGTGLPAAARALPAVLGGGDLRQPGRRPAAGRP